jgi:hypothetical protein
LGGNLRTIELDGEPWFVASDICRCLGLKAHPSNGGYTGHLEKLDKDEKRVATVADAPTNPIGGAPAKRRQTLINESGMYRLTLRSDKDTARPFQDWVTKVAGAACKRMTRLGVARDGQLGATLGERTVAAGGPPGRSIRPHSWRENRRGWWTAGTDTRHRRPLKEPWEGGGRGGKGMLVLYGYP